MGNKLFGVDIASIVAKNVGPGVLAATLTKTAIGSRTPGQLTGGTNPTTTPYSCRGFIDSQVLKDRTGTIVDTGVKVIVLIGDTISSGTVAPETDDRITIEGTVYRIETIDRDPAAATYTCGCRAV